jgi:hypothetical protein
MSAHHESQPRPPQPVSRLGLYLPLALLMSVALAWCGFWFYAARLAESNLADFKSSEASQGRRWTCADQKIEGFPFRIELHCASLVLDATLDGRQARTRTGALHAATQIYSPTLVLADIDGPMVIETEATTTSAAWDNMRVSVRFSNRLERLSLVMANPQIEVQTATGEKLASAAKSAEAHVRFDPTRPANDQAIDLAVQLTELNSPAINAWIGSPEKVDFAIAGVATKLADLQPQGWRNLLEAWRMAGGNFTVDKGAFAKGGLQLEAKGQVNLDAARRMQGKLDVSAKGIGPLVARFGGGGMNQLIGPLLTRKDGTPVQWPVQLQDGRIQMGPLRTGAILSPLY